MSPIVAVAVGGDGADLADLLGGRDLLGALLDVLDHGLDGDVDAAPRSIGFMPAATAFTPSRTMAWASTVARGGAVAGEIVGLGGDLAHHLGAHVLELVGELDLLGDGHAVLGDAGRAERLVEHDAAALRARASPSRRRPECRRHGACARAHRPRISRLSQP